MKDEDSNNELLRLDSLRKELSPPAELEERIVSHLNRRKLIRHHHRDRFLTFQRVVAAAACILFFLAGTLYQKAKIGKQSSAVSMSESTFVLFLLEDDSYQDAQGMQQQQERISAYRDWAIGLRKQGIPVSGTKLHDEQTYLGKAIEEERGQEQISGYFLIDATSAEQALAIARNCPHLRYGGKIEVRRVHPV